MNAALTAPPLLASTARPVDAVASGPDLKVDVHAEVARLAAKLSLRARHR